MRFLYNFFIKLIYYLSWVVSYFFLEIKKWFSAHKESKKLIQKSPSQPQKNIWIHAASLGEYEQGKPIIAKISKHYPHYNIILTFFSPSGYHQVKTKIKNKSIFLLPIDTKQNAKKFIQQINPQLAIFIKSEFWYNYMIELQKASIPYFFISSRFRSDQYFFKWYGKWFRTHLKKAHGIFVQDKNSKLVLDKFDFSNTEILGDTRFDTVYENTIDSTDIPYINNFTDGKQVFIAGSTYAKEENMLFSMARELPEVKFIIAPHQINMQRLNEIKNIFKSTAINYSELNDQSIINKQVLIIDSIGILSKLYRYADVCYIGGGFKRAIHNIQEAIVFGKPVIFGPKYTKFKEATDLVEAKAAFSIKTQNELLKKSKQLLSDDSYRKKISDICIAYIQKNIGASEIIIKKIDKILK